MHACWYVYRMEVMWGQTALIVFYVCMYCFFKSKISRQYVLIDCFKKEIDFAYDAREFSWEETFLGFKVYFFNR